MHTSDEIIGNEHDDSINDKRKKPKRNDGERKSQDP